MSQPCCRALQLYSATWPLQPLQLYILYTLQRSTSSLSWASDIGQIYQRALAEAHLRGSAAVGAAEGADLESLCRGWVQPASFR